MTFCETCIHREVCKHRSTTESIETNLSSLTSDWNIPDILKVQLKCEKFMASPFTYRNEARANGGEK